MRIDGPLKMPRFVPIRSVAPSTRCAFDPLRWHRSAGGIATDQQVIRPIGQPTNRSSDQQGIRPTTCVIRPIGPLTHFCRIRPKKCFNRPKIVLTYQTRLFMNIFFIKLINSNNCIKISLIKSYFLFKTSKSYIVKFSYNPSIIITLKLAAIRV